MPSHINDVLIPAMYEEFDDVLYIEYDPYTNRFYDQCGFHIINIYEIVTPNDIFLFKKNHLEHSWFNHRGIRNVVCKIIMNGVEDDEEYDIIPCGFSSGSGCFFSGNQEGSREEICRYCRG